MSKNNTKRALVLNALSILLCFSLLLGTTLAWFTDTVASSGNRIIAGDLKIDLLMDKGSGYVSIADGSGDIFNEIDDGLWEPGKTKVAYLAVQNKGNLALKYNIFIDVTDDGLVGALEYAIINDVTSSTVFSSWQEIIGTAGALTGNLAEGRTIAAPNGCLDEIAYDKSKTNETDYFMLAVHMKESAGNEYKNKSAIIDVTVVAGQVNAEQDSFGKDYDKNAPLPIVAIPINTSTNGNVGSEADGSTKFEPKGAIISAVMDAPASGIPMIVSGSSTGGIPVSGIALKDSDTAATLTLKVETSATTNNSIVYEISLKADVTVSSGGTSTTSSYDVAELSEYVTVSLYIGKDLSGVAVNHDGVAMTRVSNLADIAADTGSGIFTYDSVSGILTIKAKTFSPFEVIYNPNIKSWDGFSSDTSWYNPDDNEFVIYTAAQLKGLSDLSNSGINFSGKKIYLGADIDLNGKPWTPIGNREATSGGTWFAGSIDGRDHTIKGLYINCAETGYARNRALISLYSGPSIKNLTIEGAYVRDTVVAGQVSYSSILASCVMGSSEISNITVRNTELICGTNGGLLISRTYGGHVTISNITIENSQVTSRQCGAILGLVQDLGNGLSIRDVILKNVGISTYDGSYLIGIVSGWSTGNVSNITATGAKYNSSVNTRILTNSISEGVTVSGLNIRTDSLNNFATLVVVPDGKAAGSVSGKIIVGTQEYQIPDNYTGGSIG